MKRRILQESSVFSLSLPSLETKAAEERRSPKKSGALAYCGVRRFTAAFVSSILDVRFLTELARKQGDKIATTAMEAGNGFNRTILERRHGSRPS